MARNNLYDQVEWFRRYGEWMLPTYGVLRIGEDWHAVVSDEDCAHGFRVLTTVKDRKTAIGFLKLLKE